MTPRIVSLVFTSIYDSFLHAEIEIYIFLLFTFIWRNVRIFLLIDSFAFWRCCWEPEILICRNIQKLFFMIEDPNSSFYFIFFSHFDVNFLHR